MNFFKNSVIHHLIISTFIPTLVDSPVSAWPQIFCPKTVALSHHLTVALDVFINVTVTLTSYCHADVYPECQKSRSPPAEKAFAVKMSLSRRKKCCEPLFETLQVIIYVCFGVRRSGYDTCCVDNFIRLLCKCIFCGLAFRHFAWPQYEVVKTLISFAFFLHKWR